MLTEIDTCGSISISFLLTPKVLADRTKMFWSCFTNATVVSSSIIRTIASTNCKIKSDNVVPETAFLEFVSTFLEFVTVLL